MKVEFLPQYKVGDIVCRKEEAFMKGLPTHKTNILNIHPWKVLHIIPDTHVEDRLGEPGCGHTYVCVPLHRNDCKTHSFYQYELQLWEEAKASVVAAVSSYLEGIKAL